MSTAKALTSQGGTLDRYSARASSSTYRLQAGQPPRTPGFKHFGEVCTNPSGLRGTRRLSTLSFCSGRRGPALAGRKEARLHRVLGRQLSKTIEKNRFPNAGSIPQGDTPAGGSSAWLQDRRHGLRGVAAVRHLARILRGPSPHSLASLRALGDPPPLRSDTRGRPDVQAKPFSGKHRGLWRGESEELCGWSSNTFSGSGDAAAHVITASPSSPGEAFQVRTVDPPVPWRGSPRPGPPHLAGVGRYWLPTR